MLIYGTKIQINFYQPDIEIQIKSLSSFKNKHMNLIHNFIKVFSVVLGATVTEIIKILCRIIPIFIILYGFCSLMLLYLSHGC